MAVYDSAVLYIVEMEEIYVRRLVTINPVVVIQRIHVYNLMLEKFQPKLGL